MSTQRTTTWEHHPSLLVTDQYSRCLERLLGTLPPPVQRHVAPALLLAIGRMRAGIAVVQRLPPRACGPLAEVPSWLHDAALGAVAESLALLALLRRERLGARAENLVAVELLERIEDGLR